MTNTTSRRATELGPDDERVFEKLTEAQSQYEEYLAITQSAAVIMPDESLVLPPAPDLPLSLTIRRDAY